MLVLYDAANDCVLVAQASVANRMGAHLAASRLDRALANGASPDSTVWLSLRARALIRPAERRALAKSLDRILAATPRPASRGPWPVTPAFCGRVATASAELRELGERLRRAGPVSAEGMAKVRVLLTDGAGPLYRSTGDLARAVREAIQSLEPKPNWG